MFTLGVCHERESRSRGSRNHDFTIVYFLNQRFLSTSVFLPFNHHNEKNVFRVTYSDLLNDFTFRKLSGFALTPSGNSRVCCLSLLVILCSILAVTTLILSYLVFHQLSVGTLDFSLIGLQYLSDKCCDRKSRKLLSPQLTTCQGFSS